jgi:cytochrome P450
LFDTIRNAYSWFRDPYGFLDQRIKQGVYDFRVDLPGSEGAMFVGTPDLVHEVARNKHLAGGAGLRFVQPFTGPRALIVISGEEHQHRRRPIQQMFYQADNPRMAELTGKYFDLVARELKQDQVFSLLEFYEQVTLRTIIDYVLGVSEDEHEEILGLLQQWMQSFKSPIWLFLKPLQQDLGTLSPWGRFLRGRDAILQWIGDRLETTPANSESVLGTLIADRDDGELQISDEDLVWQCMELLLFGHDTTACGSAWVTMHLLDHSMIESAELESPEYREACIKEALRYTPMVIHVTREAIEDTRLGNQTIRKGQKVFPCAYLAHHHRDHYKNPETFDPGRFLHGNSPSRYAWFPFGIGKRLCVGMPFAMTQMQILLKRTLELGQIDKASTGKTLPERKFIIMAPQNGGLVRYKSFS